uniref:Myb-like domain-containing protein n=1 Tax=Mycena chlorophos TaxID=658473 RepID=A0ABQ0LKN7_MYCCL|nr:predicted protein [Mycena chlorophos]
MHTRSAGPIADESHTSPPRKAVPGPKAPAPAACKSKHSSGLTSRRSPSWDVNSDDFNLADCDYQHNSEDDNASRSPLTPAPNSHRFLSPNDDNDDDMGVEPLVQANNARTGRWLSWEDRALARMVEKHRPFNAGRGPDLERAWDELAVKLESDSRQDPKSNVIQRSGAACKARFLKLLKHHKAEETRSLQKTGADELVDAYIQVMTDLVQLFDAKETIKKEKSVVAQKKMNAETQAALELRDAAMKGRVRREDLSDIARLEGTSIREKQGQRKYMGIQDDRGYQRPSP